MSKELIERLRSAFPTTQAQWEAADHIEELEREKTELMLKVTKFWYVAASYKNECDALLADNARLRNKVRDECAGVCDRFAEREMHPAECAAAIRVMKEPE